MFVQVLATPYFKCSSRHTNTEIIFFLIFCNISLYWKIKYISRLEYLWEDVKKGDVDIPQFVQDHDKILENRPLTDYGIEPDPLHLTAIPSAGYPFGRFEDRWSSREYMS